MRAFLVVLMLVPVAGAQVIEIEDPEDDVAYDGSSADDTPQVYEAVDIVAARIGNEDADSIEFGLQLKAATNTRDASVFATTNNADVRFTFGGQEHVVNFGYVCNREDEARFSGPGGGECLPITMDGDMMTARVPKEWIFDAGGFNIGPGDIIEWYVEVEDGNLEGRVRDFAPDVGLAPIFQLAGSAAADSLRFDRPSITRASNGGPDVFVYGLNLQAGPETQAAFIEVEDIPDGWDVRGPVRVELTDGQVRFPVIVSTPSGHVHGGTETFTVRASAADVEAETRIGIYYLDVPQPAGHHNRIFLHAERDEGPFWANTLEEDRDGTQAIGLGSPPAVAVGNHFTVESQARWEFPLDPELVVGLDFDTTAEGLGEFTLELPVEANVVANASVVLTGPGCQGDCLLASGASGIKSVSSTPTTVNFPLTPYPAADLIPFTPQSNIVFSLRLSMEGAFGDGDTGPRLHRDASFFELPLHDYKDPIDQSFERFGVLEISAETDRKELNPGGRGWTVITLSNTGSVRVPADLAIVGPLADWATVEPGSLDLAPGEDGVAAVQIDVPEGMPAGTRAEGFVVAEVDGQAQAMIKIAAEVVAAPVPEESKPVLPTQEDKPTPLPLGLMLAGLAVALLRRH